MRDRMLPLIAFLAIAAPAAPLPSPALATAAAAQDVSRLPAKERRHYRYLWVPVPATQREEFLVVLKVHCNLLSSQGDFGEPYLVAPDVVRLDIRDFGWDKRAEVWENFAKRDVYFHQQAEVLTDTVFRVAWPGGPFRGKHYPAGMSDMKVLSGGKITLPAAWASAAKMLDGTPAVTYLREECLTEAPVLNAQWFFVQTARQISIRNEQEGTGYYDFLGLKKRDDFFRLTGADQKLAQEIFREWRAIVVKSGISQQNRQVITFGAVSGRVWGTLDTFKEAGRGIAKRNLRPGEFAHDAEEWIGTLPNGLPLTALFAKDGTAQESAPDKIGPDDSALNTSRDFRVHANLSCIRCHGTDKDFLKPIDDWARKTFRAGGVLRLQEPDKKAYLELKSLYLRDLNRLLARDREDFVDILAKATTNKKHPKGMTWPQFARAYAKAWDDYVQKDLTSHDAAREMGVTQPALMKALKAYDATSGKTDLVLAALLDSPPQKITRLEWEDTYALATTLALGLRPPEIEKKRKKLP